MAFDPDIVLPAELASYRDQRASKKTRMQSKVDGSLMELRIATYLVRAGWEDNEILDYFDHHQLPRHVEDIKESGSSAASVSRIATARMSVSKFSQNPSISDETDDEEEGLPHTPLHVIESGHNPQSQTYSSATL